MVTIKLSRVECCRSGGGGGVLLCPDLEQPSVSVLATTVTTRHRVMEMPTTCKHQVKGAKDMLWSYGCPNARTFALLLSLFRPFLSDFYHYLLVLVNWEMRLAIFNLPFLLTPQFFSCTHDILVPTPDTGQIDGQVSSYAVRAALPPKTNKVSARAVESPSLMISGQHNLSVVSLTPTLSHSAVCSAECSAGGRVNTCHLSPGSWEPVSCI